MKKLYFGLMIVGAAVPYYFFVQFFLANGVSISSFTEGLFANGAAGGFSADLLISSFIFWLFMYQNQKENGGPRPYIFIALNLFIGLSCALPAYLYVREK